jgi:hypothetical protein
MNQPDAGLKSPLPTASDAPEQLKWWLPVDALIDNGRPAVEWMDLREVSFDEPFFHETVARVKANRAADSVITDLDFLLQMDKICDAVEPAGFIFHTSRCGSTLLANACRSLNGSLVMAEAPVLDKIASRFFTDAERSSTKELLYMLFLKAAVTALGQRPTVVGNKYFVKFACTSTLQMRRIRRVWPNVPFVFLYRDPVEVIVSNLRSMPEWMRPKSNPTTAAAIVDVDVYEVENLTPEEFCARAMGRFFAEALASVDGPTKHVNYIELTSPDGLVAAVRFFGIQPSTEELDAIKEVSRLYSKDSTRSRTFQSDGQSKRASASASVIELAAKWALPFYEQLNNRT